jgi:hypothetical protein
VAFYQCHVIRARRKCWYQRETVQNDALKYLEQQSLYMQLTAHYSDVTQCAVRYALEQHAQVGRLIVRGRATVARGLCQSLCARIENAADGDTSLLMLLFERLCLIQRRAAALLAETARPLWAGRHGRATAAACFCSQLSLLHGSVRTTAV